MIIVNADDWGRSVVDTNAAATLFEHGRVTSVSAMVFMDDSERAASLAKEIGIDVGLHVNFCESFGDGAPAAIRVQHESICDFMNRGRYAQLLYNPRLRSAFHAVYQAQADEFRRLYGSYPSRVDGHRHLHLCANMLLDSIIPAGIAVRRSFTFERGEKGIVNRLYRRLVDRRLSSRHTLTDHFLSLERCLSGRGRQMEQVAALAKDGSLELMTHPRNSPEFEYLGGVEFAKAFRAISKGTYLQIVRDEPNE